MREQLGHRRTVVLVLVSLHFHQVHANSLISLKIEMLAKTHFRYLDAGRDMLASLQSSARCTCGYCHIADVEFHTQEDHMESFFLAETVSVWYSVISFHTEMCSWISICGIHYDSRWKEKSFHISAHLLTVQLNRKDCIWSLCVSPSLSVSLCL